MTPKQAAFVAEYVKDGNATQAAIRAGYSEATAMQQGSRLLSHVEISAALVEVRSRALEEVRRETDEAVGTAAWIIRNAAETHAEARSAGQYGAAVSALKLMSEPLTEFKEAKQTIEVNVLIVGESKL